MIWIYGYEEKGRGRPKCFIGPDSTTGPFTFQPKPTSPCLCKFCISDCPTKINGRKCIVFSHPCLPHHPDRRSDTSGLFFPTPSLVSLGHSLMTRVANLRASRGDHSGAERARAVAATLERLELALGG
ncbi:hypothetical protein CK203_110840 [Vitis vinifera]|uniref:Uncharacterized protein n=1 Tax=Vitis vinifera TaxID=29760 RepID=A0A438CAD1_VITVI|nr:hypothetical protein CK203_110840 [Vitis vinifera]